MPRALSSQEKLALALTSAGSMRELARRLGTTHQRVGRWLREGESGGVKSIPSDLFTTEAIETVYRSHVDDTRARAKADRLPFNAAAPVYMERKTLATGQPGDRVIAEQTQFIRSALRGEIMQGAHDSRKFVSSSVRSIVNLRSYFRSRAVEEIKRRQRRDVTPAQLAKYIERDFKSDMASLHNRTIDTARPFPLYTQKEGLLIGRKGDRRTARSIETKLREKHEPATGEAGTVFADKYLFQTIPADYVSRKKPRSSKRRR